ncbi:hypothetical protein DPMN_009239 [Dreissena polymorpha]|uniref:Uncharacterized protein n=1 Tax=Dreissena polymorpha TaxID=45954 RepID=A0A9D4MZ87_DREPO|nr:hypothetical protein DPMN_009239 [Dreissena polymorpha]
MQYANTVWKAVCPFDKEGNKILRSGQQSINYIRETVRHFDQEGSQLIRSGRQFVNVQGGSQSIRSGG